MTSWGHLQNAVLTLVGEGTLRERIVRCCLTNLADIRLKELPQEVHAPFLELVGLVRVADDQQSALVIATLSDADLRRLAVAIVEMYDAVARYQPRPTMGRTGPRI